MYLGWISVHIGLLKEGKVGNIATAWANKFQAIQNLGILSWFLVVELRTGEAQDYQLGELNQQLVVLLIVHHRHTSERGDVGDEDHLPLVFGELDHFTLQSGGIERIDCRTRRTCGV